jgi:hypothetical protein
MFLTWVSYLVTRESASKSGSLRTTSHRQPHASATSSEAKGCNIVNWVCVLVFVEQEDKTNRLAYLVILLADEGPEEDLGIWCMAAATKSAIDVVPQRISTVGI